MSWWIVLYVVFVLIFLSVELLARQSRKSEVQPYPASLPPRTPAPFAENPPMILPASVCGYDPGALEILEIVDLDT